MTTAKSLKAGMRVRSEADRSKVGTVVRLTQKTATVSWDDGTSSTAPKRELSPKRGRTKGTVAIDPEPIDEVAFACVVDEVVRARMKLLKMSWTALSQRSGLSRATIARVLRDGAGQQPLSTIEELARALGVHPGEFWRPGPPHAVTESSVPHAQRVLDAISGLEERGRDTIVATVEMLASRLSSVADVADTKARDGGTDAEVR